MYLPAIFLDENHENLCRDKRVRVGIRTKHLPTASIKRYYYISCSVVFDTGKELILLVNRILQRTYPIFRVVG
jgi:hypothetical protein